MNIFDARRTVPFLVICASVATPLIAQRSPAPSASVVVRAENPLPIARPDEVLSVPWATLGTHLSGLSAARVRVVDVATGAEIASQTIDADADRRPEELLMQASFWPGETKEFRIEAAAPTSKPTPRAYAKHEPYRDDVAWETDRIAYRIYGQGLWKASEFQPLVSSGIDVWPKRVPDLIVDRWYEKGHDAYHIDTGEGADFYTVGPTLGAGGSAIWRDGKMYHAKNFKSQRILANGPIRTVFELQYEPWDAGGIEVSEVKRITMDAGQNIFRQEITYSAPAANEISYVVGTVKRDSLVGSTNRSADWAWLSTWGPVERKNGGHGQLGTAVLMENSRLVDTRETESHYVAVATAAPGVPTVQYVGAGWTASGDFRSVEDWWRHLDTFAQRLANPVKLSFWSKGNQVAQQQ